MMHVERQPEPLDFDSMVRKKGERFLKRTPMPTGEQWRSHDYWTGVKAKLHEAYSGICNFSCHWIPYDTGSRTVEHFRPKSKYPQQAYEWSNFRLVCGTLNGRKGDYEDVLDPFTIADGTFILEFPSLLVKPSKSLDDATAVLARSTIARLQLNDDGTCLKGRERYVKRYCLDEIDFPFMVSEAPFIASELRRQRLVRRIKLMMVYS